MTSNKILWAVDPFDKSINSPAIERLLKQLTGPLHSEVLPTFVLSGVGPAPWQVANSKGIQKEADRKIRRMKLPKLKSTKVLVSPSNSVRAATEKLGKFARSEKAEAIVLPSHGRSGLSRLAMGSFAETLMLQSRMPLIIVNPKTKVSEPIKRIVFATDLAPSSKKALEGILGLAKRLGAKVTVYHAIPEPVYPMTFAGVVFVGAGAMVPTPEEVNQMAASSRRKAEEWVGARKDVEIVIEKNVVDVSSAITRFAKKSGAQLIAIEARSHALSAALAGSVTRNVVRNAACPVWITRTKK